MPLRGLPIDLKCSGVDGERPAPDLDVDLEAVAAEDALVLGLAERRELGRMQAEVGVGYVRMAGHAHELDRLAVRRFRSRIMTATSMPRESLPEVVYFWR